MISSRIKLKNVDLLTKGPRYTYTNIRSMPYTADVVEHYLRYHYPKLISTYQSDEDVCVVLCDLTSAIKSLPPLEQAVVRFVVNGWELRDLTEDGVPARTGLPMEECARTFRRSCRLMAQFLGDGK